jgi:23S rRNA (uridine2552-2'-O)-methyltransferase
MGSQWGYDRMYARAVKEGYRSRAAYKLKDIQERFHVIRDGDHVIDLGAAPGSWLQVVTELTGESAVGIDLSSIPPLDRVLTITGDFTDPAVAEHAVSLLPIVNVVLSDAAPKLSGNRSYDQARAIALGEEALSFACRVLMPGGNFVIKSFQGEDFPRLLDEVRRSFRSARVFRTHATRRGSTEVYIIAKQFTGRA